MRYELLIAMRYLRARRKSAFISITAIFTAIGVTIGVAALAIVLSVMNGFESNLRSRVLSLSPQIQILSLDGAITQYAGVERVARTVPGVVATDPFIIGQALISSGRGVSGAAFRGVDVGNPYGALELRRYIVKGELASLGKTPSKATAGAANGLVAVGADLAAKLKLHIGDPIRVVAPIIVPGAHAELATKTSQFTVGALFDSGVAYVDENVVFVGLRQAQLFFGRGQSVDGIEVRIKNLDATAAITDRLRELLPQPYRVRDWMEFNQAASAGFKMLRRVYSLVLLLLIGVAAFNLVATLIMIVMEKRKDIAVLMTMGASRRDIRLIFVLKGLIVGGIGTLAGLALGAIGCFALARYHFIEIPKEIYGISTLPIQVMPSNFALVALASILLCLVAAVYPARQASRQMPAEIMRS